jgi:hypothetical protein
MKTILPVLIIAIIGASCATDHVSVPESQTQVWSAQMGGLSWLAHQQRPDGYWGNNEHRVALTSLATLAFLSHGETPASPKYGEAVENGLRALLQVSNNSPDLSPSDRALITWCLAETYGMTRIPTVLDSARTHASLLDSEVASHWNVYAGHSLVFSGAAPERGKELLSSQKAIYAHRADDLMNRTIYSLLLAWTGERNPHGFNHDAEDEKHSKEWRQTEKPLQTAFLLTQSIYRMGGKEWDDWNKIFFPELVRSQRRKANYGWWSPKSLGIRNTREADGMTAKESRIYATSLMLMTFPRRRNLPSFQPLPEDRIKELLDEDDIIIEII